jgi:hypothetical protein
MLVVLLGIGCVRLYYAGYVPKLILMANAYSVTPSQIVKRVVSRRLARCPHARRPVTHRPCLGAAARPGLLNCCPAHAWQGTRDRASDHSFPWPRRCTLDATSSCSRSQVSISGWPDGALRRARAHPAGSHRQYGKTSDHGRVSANDMPGAGGLGEFGNTLVAQAHDPSTCGECGHDTSAQTTPDTVDEHLRQARVPIVAAASQD